VQLKKGKEEREGERDRAQESAGWFPDLYLLYKEKKKKE